MTLNDIIFKIIKPIAEDHIQVKDFGFGDLEKYATTKEAKFPLVWVVTKSIDYSNNSLDYSFTLVFADIIKEDLSNIIEIQSDCITIASDFAGALRNHANDEIEVENEFTLTPFSERFIDVTAGVTMEIKIKTLEVLSGCFPSKSDLLGSFITTETNEPLITEEGENIAL